MNLIYVISICVLQHYVPTNIWLKYVHEVLVNRLGGLSLPKKSVVRLTDRPDMTLNVYRGRKMTTTITTNEHLGFARARARVCVLSFF